MRVRAASAVFVMVVLFAGSGATAQPDSREDQNSASARPSLRAGRVDGGTIRLDGRLSEPAWATADTIDDLQTVEPEVGVAPVARTTVRVLATADELLIGIVCRDPEPDGIVSFSKARDADLESEDHVAVVLDTYLDARTGYLFAVNPDGARLDALVIESGDLNENWDAVWEARTARDADGWSVEIRIPIKSLAYRPGERQWGFNVQRRIQRLQETSRWSGVSQDYDLTQTGQAGRLIDLPEFSFGLGLSVRPAVTTGASRPSSDEGSEVSGDVSLDLTQKFGPNFQGSFTANTDFAETEVDARQTNLSRFEIFFPEKRTFFLEGTDIFEFGLGLDDVVVPFFSRRVGLVFPEEDDGIEVPINAGGKIHGRLEDTNLSALVVNTRAAPELDLDSATMGAARIKQNILEESSVGFIGTVGDQLGRTGAWTAGGDLVYQTSEFRDEKNLEASAWLLANGRDDLEGDRAAWGVTVDYPNDLWEGSFMTARIAEGFDPSLGFVPRTAIHLWEGDVEFSPRPNWSAVRQMFHEVSFQLVNDLDNRWESYQTGFTPVNWLLESGDGVTFAVLPQGDRPDEPFEVFENEERTVEIEAGDYRWTRYAVGATLAEKRKVSGELHWEFGGFYDGDLDVVEGLLVLEWPLLSVELGAERNIGRLAGGDFTQDLFSARVELKMSPDLQLSSFLQFDNESNSLATNTRLRWTFDPLGDLFVVYNHNVVRAFDDLPARRWELDSNEFIVKFQYAWRP